MAKKEYKGHFESNTVEIDVGGKKVRVFNDKKHIAAVKAGLAKKAKK